jgi:hypothetical protein
MALGMLAEHINRPEIKSIFAGFLDDWDVEVRKISALALVPSKKDKETTDAAARALDIETDETVKALLQRLARGKENGPRRRKSS